VQPVALKSDSATRLLPARVGARVRFKRAVERAADRRVLAAPVLPNAWRGGGGSHVMVHVKPIKNLRGGINSSLS
jgi:hypothetical protein